MTLPAPLANAAIPAPVREVLQTLLTAGQQAFLVGGCVRDLLRGEPPKDFDVATSARPEQVMALFRKVIPTGVQHGTVTVLQRGAHVEITTFRAESEYVDGRRPSRVEFHADITADLSRRDFTINAMAFDPIGRRLEDPFGGERDLDRKIIRCVGDPNERFGEDGLRVLRAVRLAAVLGFVLEERTREAIPGALGVYRKVAQERVREELQKLLLSRRPALGVQMLVDTGLMATSLPETLEGIELPRRQEILERAPQEVELRLASLFLGVLPERANAALRRLTFPTRTVETVTKLLASPLPLSLSDVELRRYAARLGTEALALALRFAGAVHGSGDVAAVAAQVERMLAARPPLTPRELALNGGQIMRLLQIGPSPKVGEATRMLMDRVLEEPSRNTPAALERILETWSRSGGN